MNRIKELRLKCSLTQKELSENTAIPQNSLSQYESGKRRPKIETWQKLADYFDVDIGYIQGISSEKRTYDSFKDVYADRDLMPRADDEHFYMPDPEKFREIMTSISYRDNFKLVTNVMDALTANNDFHDSFLQGVDDYQKVLSDADPADFSYLSNLVTEIFKIGVASLAGDNEAKKIVENFNKESSLREFGEYEELDNNGEPIRIIKRGEQS